MKRRVNNVFRLALAGSVKWFCAGLCFAAVFGLSACKDDDEGGDGGGAGAVAQQMPLVANAGIQFPVTQYSERNDMETYTYADGRMTGAATSREKSSYSITSNPLVLTEQNFYSDTDYRICTVRNIRVNENGFMTYAEISDYGINPYEDEWSEGGSVTYSYDAEGHLVSESGTYTEGSSTFNWTCTYTWENGNLMNMDYRGEDEEEAYHDVYTFVYGDGQWNNPGVYPVQMMDISIMEMPLVFYSGLMGRTTKNIPTSVTVTESDVYGGEIEGPSMRVCRNARCTFFFFVSHKKSVHVL